jgi:hypothetical protein
MNGSLTENGNLIRLGITTAPRPGESYLPQTILSLERAGFEPPFHIFAEPNTPLDAKVVAPHTVVQRPAKLGEWRNWIDGLRMLHAVVPAAASLAIVQDDVIFCLRVREALEARLWPSERCGAVQFYTSRRYRGQKDFPRGLSKLPKRFYYRLNSACAITLRPNVAAEILQYAAENPWRGWQFETDVPEEIQELDIFVGRALADLGWEIWCCNPSLAFHVGQESALNHGGALGARQALDFPGEDADAREVLLTP